MASVPSTSLQAAVVTVGTEITDGQIVDRNSAWISQKLEALDVRVQLHISVPDDEKLMLAAFQTATQNADLVFICGGLGPTVDDFTRDVIATFTGQPLAEDPVAKKSIEQKIAGRNLPVRPGHYRQAQIPQGGTVLENSHGVAPGFSLVWKGKRIWALPGPPKEIEAIWKDHVEKDVSALPRPAQRLKLHTWLCLNVAESEMAQITEDFFNPLSFEKQYGYRISMPYVEVKVWFDPADPKASGVVSDFTAHIQKFFVAHHLREAHLGFIDFISAFKELQIIDGFSQGLLLQKIKQVLPENLQKLILLSYAMNGYGERRRPGPETLRIEVAAAKDQKINWVLTTAQGEKNIPVTLPSSRSSQYTLLYALEELFLKASKA